MRRWWRIKIVAVSDGRTVGQAWRSNQEYMNLPEFLTGLWEQLRRYQACNADIDYAIVLEPMDEAKKSQEWADYWRQFEASLYEEVLAANKAKRYYWL